MKIRKPYSVLLVCYFLAFTSGQAFAQQAAGTINGEVVDIAGIIPAATVVATNSGTNVSRTTETNELGRYSLPAMEPGIYTVTISRAEFKQAVAKDVRLDVDQVLTLNFTLEPEAVETSVEVVATAALVEKESATVGQVLESRQVEQLPLNGRNFLQLTTLGPGTVSGYTRDASRQGGTRADSRFDIAVNGGRSEFTNILLDGMLDTDENFNTFIMSPSVDAIREFKVHTSHAYGTNIVSQAGIQGLSANPIDFGLPTFSVLGITNWGDNGFSYPSLLRDQVYQFSDNLSIARGRHTINLGGEFRSFNYANFANNLTRGSYSFTSPLYTSNPSAPRGTGAGFADYLPGVPQFAEGSVGDTSIYDVRKSYNLYLQDDIKLTRKLTVNLGLRYEINPYPVEKFDRIETLDLSTNPPTIVRAGQGDPYFFYPKNIKLDPSIPYVRDGRLGHSLLQTNWKNLGPRFGIAYALKSNTAIRGGYGIYYSQDIGNPFFDLARNVPRNVRASLNSDPLFPHVNMATVFSGLQSGQSVLFPTLTMTDPPPPDHLYPAVELQRTT